MHFFNITVIKNFQKSLIFFRAKRATFISEKPLVNHLCPLKIFSDSFRICLFTVQNDLKESEKNFKGQKRITKGFKSNATRNDKSENFKDF